VEAEGLLQCSQDSSTGPFPKPDASSAQLPTYLCKIHSNIILPLIPRSSK